MLASSFVAYCLDLFLTRRRLVLKIIDKLAAGKTAEKNIQERPKTLINLRVGTATHRRGLFIELQHLLLDIEIDENQLDLDQFIARKTRTSKFERIVCTHSEA